MIPMMRPLLIALQFLTCLPLRLREAPQPAELGRSLLWYPLIGALIGSLLYGIDLVLGDAALLLRATLLLVVWVTITGALHLDGLADSADAWVGGHGDRERMLTIMKDPHVGPCAVVSLTLVLLLKFSALCAVLEHGQRIMLFLPPLLARCAMPALFASTPYVRPSGIGSAHAAHLPHRAAIVTVAVTLTGLLLIFGMPAVVGTATAVLVFILLRRLLLRRLGGTTGDTAGAMIEIIEVAVLSAAGLRG